MKDNCGSTLQTPAIGEDKVIFRWKGKGPAAVMGDFNEWDAENPAPMIEATPGIWELTLEFPADTYMEYVLLVRGKRRLDPHNPDHIYNGAGGFNNFFYMPGAAPTPYAPFGKITALGRMSEHIITDRMHLVNRKRRVTFYQPPGEGPFPLLVVYDGKDYLQRGRITQIVDALAAEGSIQPVALALVENAGSHRFLEYACSEPTVSFLLNTLIPLAQKELPLLDLAQNPGAYGVMGGSMGGLMALYTALRAPRVFGKAICQAGAYQIREEEFIVFDLVKYLPDRPARVWLDVGRYDFLLETNRRMAAHLRGNGFEMGYLEYNGGHNYTCWRNHLHLALQSCFPTVS
jgi:enterochelin esterase-like enzyme